MPADSPNPARPKPPESNTVVANPAIPRFIDPTLIPSGSSLRYCGNYTGSSQLDAPRTARAGLRSVRGVHPTAHLPRFSTAAAHPTPVLHGGEPPAAEVWSRRSRCRVCAEHMVADRWQHFTSPDLPGRSVDGQPAAPQKPPRL
jgi:hypothetical protein